MRPPRAWVLPMVSQQCSPWPWDRPPRAWVLPTSGIAAVLSTAMGQATEGMGPTGSVAEGVVGGATAME